MSKEDDDESDLWKQFLKTVTKKKESPLQDDLIQQKKVEIRIRDSRQYAPRDKRFETSFGALQADLFKPGFLAKKDTKKISKTLPIQAKLDLHGMTQDQAHKQLKTFIQNCFSHQIQDTLVITGKGLTPKSTSSVGEEEKKGILRRRLPQWLESQALRNYVHFYTNSHPFEGSTGAFYVRLRRNKQKRK